MVKHPVILRGYYSAINERATAPVLVKRTDQEFIPALLDGVRRRSAPDDLGRIGREAVDSKEGALRLFQPVHRTFNLVLLEAICDRPGSPRLNPRDIASAGFVVRRFNNSTDEGWMLRNERVLGWSRPADPKLDPDPSQRKPRLNAGNPHVNGKLSRIFAALEPAGERVSPLFVAPPDVCAQAGRTVLYGMVPVTSAERSDEPLPAEVDIADVNAIMPGFLRTGPIDFPIPDSSSFDQIDNVFVQDLRLIQFGWRAFGEAPESKALLSVLNRIQLQFNNGPRALGDYLKDLCAAVILRDNTGIGLPNKWPRPNATQAADISAAAQRSLEAAIKGGLPNEQRFDQPGAVYRVHAFMRVQCADGCPPHLQWSEPSAAFQIVPWWESGGKLPLHTISLPDIDADNVKQLRPNISFAVPPKLAALLRINSPQDFIDGAKKPGAGDIGIRWICSFSIPIITLCAFIVLNIFLTLLHIVFQWLFYIKICLPYPSKR